jgi:DNA-binding FadR family transcriptional regulator
MLEFNMDVIKRPGQRLVALRHHHKIDQAISEENPDKARLAMLRHLENIFGGKEPKKLPDSSTGE